MEHINAVTRYDSSSCLESFNIEVHFTERERERERDARTCCVYSISLLSVADVIRILLKVHAAKSKIKTMRESASAGDKKPVE
ncbi:hypothetical protein EVAR_63864_1 [Eumeta japonica]|uniref:Uncharacterized protein n=1 Tax=Eumeta variegata TaxID=151549 RepID=A0A4C2A0S9_EUMVA|nr:hypothetical protein EVAR_63864_1 [Eumeta japonica]